MIYSIVLPCRNEALTIARCILKIQKAARGAEIIVVDNNSTDDSAKIAKRSGARVIHEKTQGYGAALTAGFKAAHGEYIIMCDADDTYDLEELPRLLKHTDHDIVIGNRLNRRMKKGAMPILHRYIGNPMINLIMKAFFKTKVNDTQSGFRMIRREALERLKLESTGMELASEMLIKAAKQGMRIKEVAITYYPRIGQSKLESFNDGWKHLKMMLLYSPNHLFLIPGAGLCIIGLSILLLMLNGPVKLFGMTAIMHPSILGSLFTILGYQIIMLWLYTKTYSVIMLKEQDRLVEKIFNHVNLERSIALGLALIILGTIIGIWIIYEWVSSNFGDLFEMQKSIFALTMIIIGAQTIFSGFFLSILGTKNER